MKNGISHFDYNKKFHSQSIASPTANPCHREKIKNSYYGKDARYLFNNTSSPFRNNDKVTLL